MYNLIQLTRDCLGQLLMDRYVPGREEMTEKELCNIIEEIKEELLKCNNTKQYER